MSVRITFDLIRMTLRVLLYLAAKYICQYIEYKFVYDGGKYNMKLYLQQGMHNLSFTLMLQSNISICGMYDVHLNKDFIYNNPHSPP